MGSIALDHVSKRFDATTAVDDLTLEVADEEFLVLLGPSGCGKSTALRMIAGLEQPTDGTIRIGDRVVTHVEPKDRDIAMVFQSYALYPHMSVRQNLAFGLRMRGAARVQAQSQLPQAGNRVPAHKRARLFLADVHVVAGRRLGRRREDGLRQPVGLAEAGRQPDAADRSGLLIFLPPAAREIPASDAFDGEGLGLPHEHRTAAQPAGFGRRRLRVRGRIRRYNMIGNDRARSVEPERGNLRQHFSFVRDT